MAPSGLPERRRQRQKIAHRQVLFSQLHRPQPRAEALLHRVRERAPRDQPIGDEIQREA